MKTTPSILLCVLIGACGHAAPTLSSGVTCLYRGLLVVPDLGPRSVGPGLFVSLGFPLASGGIVAAEWALRADLGVFEGAEWNASVRGELGADLRLSRRWFLGGAVGLGYMHTWQGEVYLPGANDRYGPGLDYLGSPSLFPSARLGIGWLGGPGPGSIEVVLSYETVFQVAPWYTWNSTLMSGWSLSIAFPNQQGAAQ